jgi:hypothetical protein
VFENHQRTSSRSGILKADAVVRVLKVLSEQGIETKEELLRQKNNQVLQNLIKAIPGQSSGTSYEYLLMLAGDIGTFKRDRHIIRFFANYLGVEDPSYENLLCEFKRQLNLARAIYPALEIRTLDGIIWQFMSSKTAE